MAVAATQTREGAPSERERHGRPWAPGGLAAAVGALALVFWWPLLRLHAPVSYDDGVFSAVAIALKHGARPFHGLVSTQGPLWYVALWVSAHLVGGPAAARVVAVAAGLAVVVLAMAIVRASGRREGGAAATAGILTATSGLLLGATPIVESEPLAVAFGAGAVLVALRGTTRRHAVAAGLLAAAALSTKNGLAVPAVAGAIAALLVRRRNTDALWASATTVVATVAVALPFGLHRVWEQSVELHLHTGRFHPGTNFRVVREQAWAGDRVLLLLLGAAAIVGAVACVRRRTLDPPTAAVMAAMVVWLGTALAVVVLEHQIWTHHLAVTVLPAAVLVAIALPDRAVVAALVLAVAVPWQLVTLHGVLFPDVPTPSTAAAMDDLREVTPRTALVLTDEPGLAAWAGRRIPPDQVDPSYVRATIGAIDAADVEAAAQRPDVCALLFWSQRYRFMVVVPPPGYARVRHYVGGGDLYLRAPCALPDAGR